MFWGIETSIMAPTKILTMEKKQMKPKKNMGAKQNVNEYIKNECLTLNDVETPMMENMKHTYVSKK
jgi:hypothetical protein